MLIMIQILITVEAAECYHALNVIRFTKSFFLRKLFQSIRLYIKGIIIIQRCLLGPFQV